MDIPEKGCFFNIQSRFKRFSVDYAKSLTKWCWNIFLIALKKPTLRVARRRAEIVLVGVS